MMQLLLCINFCKSEFLMQFVMRWRLLCHRKSHIMPIRSKGDVVCSFWFLRARHSDVFNLAIFSYIFEPGCRLAHQRNDLTGSCWCRAGWPRSAACCWICCSCSALAKLSGWGHRSAPVWMKAAWFSACPVSGCTRGGCDMEVTGLTRADWVLGLLTFVLDLANSKRIVWGRSGSNLTPCWRSCLAASAEARLAKVTNPTGEAVFPFLLVTFNKEPS